MSHPQNDLIYDELLELQDDLDDAQLTQVQSALNEGDLGTAIDKARWFSKQNSSAYMRAIVKANAKGKNKAQRQAVQPLDKDSGWMDL